MPLFKFRTTVQRKALQWLGKNTSEMAEFIPGTFGERDLNIDSRTCELLLKTRHGEVRCGIGDYVLIDQLGEAYPCIRAVFEATYEPVAAESVVG
jgi:hypothetical protein